MTVVEPKPGLRTGFSTLRLLHMPGWCLCVATAVGPAAAASGETGARADPAILTAVLHDGAGHRERLRRYLSERYDAPPDRVARLAMSLIGALEGRAADIGFERLRETADRIVRTTGALLAATRILALGVEAGYRPESPLLALDLGPAGAPAGGFARVDSRDRRMDGRHMTEVRGDPGTVLGTGVRGVERLELKLPDGAFRVLLLTPAADRGGPAPFGREIRVNGISYTVARPAGERWISAALLPAKGPARPAAPALSTARDGFAFVHRARGAAENGGVVVLEGHADDGKLILDFMPAGAIPVFLSAILVERAGLSSELVLGGEAIRYVTSLRDRLDFEEQVASEARGMLERVIEATGRRSLFELPRPRVPRWRGRDAG